ncbi:hypothetical protein ASF12_20425 [Paenibacillus sp. Leaf72]|nr:hypothetical protein ASF12_20425 [Paenibacillus sp. Leaf72]
MAGTQQLFYNGQHLFSLGIQFQSIFSINNEWYFGLLIKKIALPSMFHESHAIFSSFSPSEKGENCRRELVKKFSPKLF